MDRYLIHEEDVKKKSSVKKIDLTSTGQNFQSQQEGSVYLYMGGEIGDRYLKQEPKFDT